jgi:hypothetical protein
MLLFKLAATVAIVGTVVAGRGGSNVSQNGECGNNGMTCLGSYSGNCCSQYGYCGNSDAYCGEGCQAGFGECHEKDGNSGHGSKDGIMRISKSGRDLF